MRKLSIGLCLTALLSACAGAPETPQQSFDPLDASERRLGPQNLQIGQCGLFLWGQGEGRPLQFFQNTSTKQVVIPFRPGSNVTRRATNRQITDGFFAEQVFLRWTG